MNAQTTAAKITAADIRALAGRAADRCQTGIIDTCFKALGGSKPARKVCAKWIAEGR